MCPRSVPLVQPGGEISFTDRNLAFPFSTRGVTRYDFGRHPIAGAPNRGRFMNLTQYIESKRDDHLSELFEFLRIPSVSAQSDHKPDIERAAKWVANRLGAAGLENVEIVPTKMHPLVYAEFSTGTMTSSRPSRWTCGLRPHSSRQSAAETSTAAAQPTTKARCTFTFARWTRFIKQRESCPSISR